MLFCSSLFRASQVSEWSVIGYRKDIGQSYDYIYRRPALCCQRLPVVHPHFFLIPCKIVQEFHTQCNMLNISIFHQAIMNYFFISTLILLCLRCTSCNNVSTKSFFLLAHPLDGCRQCILLLILKQNWLSRHHNPQTCQRQPLQSHSTNQG